MSTTSHAPLCNSVSTQLNSFHTLANVTIKCVITDVAHAGLDSAV